MAVYPNMLTTVAGFNLIARSNATGKALIFTRGALGDGDASDKTITSLTNLVAPKMPNLAITNKRDNGNGHFTIEASVDNSELEEGFWAREMGVFAKCEGDETDVLYAYTNGGNLVPYVNDKTMPDIQLMQVDVIVGNAKNLSVTIDNSVYITEARLRTHDEDLNAHKLLATTTETPLEDFNEKLFARTGWVSKLVLKLIDKVLNALFSDTEGTLFEKAVKLIASKLVTGDVSNPNGWWIKIPAFGFNILIQGVKGMGKIDNIDNNIFYEGLSTLKLPVKASSILLTLPMVFDINPGRGENVHVLQENNESIQLAVGSNNTSNIKVGCLVFSLI